MENEVESSLVRDFLLSVCGVWLGQYTHLTVDGAVQETFASRHELRLIDGRWYERVVYRPGEPREEVHDFRGAFQNDGTLRLDAPGFQGVARLVEENRLYFGFRWDSRPGERVSELVSVPSPDRKVRVWQKFVDGKLSGLNLITEVRSPDLEPVEWR